MDGENPYFTAYRIARGLSPGDPWKGYEFSNWITARWREWRDLNAIPQTHPLSLDQRNQFGVWLKEPT